jgi:hypothetical protein
MSTSLVERGSALPGNGAPPRRIRGSDDLLIAGTALLFLILVAGDVYVVATVKKTGGLLIHIIFYCIVIGVPLLLLAGLVALIPYRRRFGEVNLVLDSYNLKLGQQVHGRIEVGSALEKFDAIRMNLACVRVHGRRSANVTVLWKEEKEIGSTDVQVQEGRTLIPILMTLPADGKPNENHLFGGDIRWVLEAEALPKRGMHFICQFTLPVVKT